MTFKPLQYLTLLSIFLHSPLGWSGAEFAESAIQVNQQLKMSTQEQLNAAQMQQQINNDAEPGVQLGVYLTATKVHYRVVALKQAYPNVFQQLNFRIKERPNKGVNLYGLRVGPFKDYAEATVFCQLSEQFGQKCVTAPFVGQAI